MDEGLSLVQMLTPDYILGLVDGEGSFTVYVRKPDDKDVRKRKVRAEPRFYLKIVERDKKILYDLKKFFGCGSVYFQVDKRPNHQNCYRYEVGSRKDLMKKIIPFFKKYHLRLRSKQKDFKVFCSLVEMMEKGEHLNQKGLERMYKVKQTMH